MKMEELDNARLQKLLEHMAEVWLFFKKEFLERSASGIDIQTVRLDEFLLTEAVMTALKDINRMAVFHLNGETEPDHYKYAAFMSKWVARFRPISFNMDARARSVGHFLVNAHFAVFVFRSFLRAEIPPEMLEMLVYTLHYRDVQPEVLGILAVACEKISNLEVKLKVLGEELASERA
jgi:hypothetical protein